MKPLAIAGRIAAAVLITLGSIGAAAAQSAEPVDGGTLRVGLGPRTGKTANLGFSGKFRNSQEFFTARAALESLVIMNESGGHDPWLATSWELDSDAGTVTFDLREGVTFHDGTPFNAEAVIWNFGQVQNLAEFAAIDRVEAVDDDTVRVHLSEWQNTFLTNVASYVTMYSPTAGAAGEEFMYTNLVGTGPFILERFEPDVVAAFVKNENYWQEGKPHLDGVNFYPYQDEASVQASFLAGEIDIIFVPDMLTVRQVAGQANVVNLESGLGASIEGVAYNSVDSNSPLSDPLVRKAIGHAINDDAIQPIITFGYSVDTNQYASPSFWTYNENVTGQPFDAAKAQELLAEAGYADGFTTTINGISTYRDLMTALQGQLAAVGVTAQVNIVDPASYEQMIGQSGSWDGLLVYSMRLEPEMGVFMSRFFTPEASRYGSKMALPTELPAMFAAINSASSQEAAQQIAWDVQELVFDEHALVKVFWMNTRPSVTTHAVQDSGVNRTMASTWDPESAWLAQ